MSYPRVIPRDLFNEANLLKCLGQLYLLLERRRDVALDHDGGAFHVTQDDSDGSLTVTNVTMVNPARQKLGTLVRPLNSRDPWPLYLDTVSDRISVLTAAGDLADDFLQFLRLSGA